MWFGLNAKSERRMMENKLFCQVHSILDEYKLYKFDGDYRCYPPIYLLVQMRYVAACMSTTEHKFMLIERNCTIK